MQAELNSYPVPIYSEAGDSTSVFNSIPEELTKEILWSLPVENQLIVENVCRRWRRIIEGDTYDNVTAFLKNYKVSINDSLFIPHFKIFYNKNMDFTVVLKEEIEEVEEVEEIDQKEEEKNDILSKKEIQMSRSLAINLFRIAKKTDKLDELKEKIGPQLEHFFYLDTENDKNSSFCTDSRKNTLDSESFVQAYIYQFLVLRQRGRFAICHQNQIIIPSLKLRAIKQCAAACYRLKDDDTHGGKLTLAINLPIELAKAIEQIVMIEEKIEQIKKEIDPDLKKIWDAYSPSDNKIDSDEGREQNVKIEEKIDLIEEEIDLDQIQIEDTYSAVNESDNEIDFNE